MEGIVAKVGLVYWQGEWNLIISTGVFDGRGSSGTAMVPVTEDQLRVLKLHAVPVIPQG